MFSPAKRHLDMKLNEIPTCFMGKQGKGLAV